jgi:hypothetical protein
MIWSSPPLRAQNVPYPTSAKATWCVAHAAAHFYGRGAR